MSSFKAKLFIDGQQRNLLYVSQTFSQYYDVTGRPTTKPIGNSLYFTIESTGNDSYFYHNMFSPSNKVNGEIVFYKRDGFSTLYKIEFAEAHIIGLQENFDHNDNLPLHMSLEIGWSAMRIKGITVKEYWNVSDPWKKVEKTKLEEKTPNLLGYSFEDEDGETIKQEKLKNNQKFYLVIQSENADGETVSINLDDDKLDFKYDGQIAKNDTLTGIPLTGDETRVELIAVRQGKIS